MKIFLSWSGKRSQKFAELLNNFLKEMIDELDPWYSPNDIKKGQRWSQEIGKKLNECNYGIICLTPENQNAPWIQFESGAISKLLTESSVFPILTCGLQNDDIKGPLNQFQSTEFNKIEMLKLLKTLNESLPENGISKEVLEKRFKNSWNEFATKVQNELNKIQFENTSDSFQEILNALQDSQLPDPKTTITTYFKSGFESHTIYSTSLKVAKKRLLIFGRKNRKLFDKEYSDFFERLNNRLINGFEFRCLFLDPNSKEEVIRTAHQEQEFKEELLRCIKKANNILSNNGIIINKTFRFYNFQRSISFIIIDDAVLFRPIEYDKNGIAKKLTKASFSMTSVSTSQGEILLSNFEEFWKSGNEKNL